MKQPYRNVDCRFYEVCLEKTAFAGHGELVCTGCDHEHDHTDKLEDFAALLEIWHVACQTPYGKTCAIARGLEKH